MANLFEPLNSSLA